VVFTSYRDGNAELYSVPLKGGTETRLTATPTLNETNASLSPSATRLAWAQGASGGITKIFYGKAGTDSSAAANPGGSGDAIESSPNWANETRLAFTSAAGGSADIYSVNVPALKTGGTGSLLTGGTKAEVEAAWDPAGTRVVFASNRSGDTELYMYTVSSGAVTRLTTRTGSDGAPSWLKDGRIVYTCVTGTTFHLCLLDPDNLAAGGTTLTTPYPADHASAVRY
jgi:TolB protein